MNQEEYSDFELLVMNTAEGNPGALKAIMDVVRHTKGSVKADHFVKLLSEFGIFGTDVYVLYSDICKRSPVQTMILLQAAKDGFTNLDRLKDFCHKQDYSGAREYPEEVREELLAKLKSKYPYFPVIL